MINFDQIIHCLSSLANNPDPQIQQAARTFIETNLTIQSPLHTQIVAFLAEPQSEARHKLMLLSSVKSLLNNESKKPDTGLTQQYHELLKLYLTSFFHVSNERAILLTYADVLMSLLHLTGAPQLLNELCDGIINEICSYEKLRIFKSLMLLKSIILEHFDSLDLSHEMEQKIYSTVVNLATRYMADFENLSPESLEVNTDQYNYWIFELIGRIINRLTVRIHKLAPDQLRAEELLKFSEGLNKLNFYDPNSLSQSYVLISPNSDSDKYKRLLRAKTCGMKLMNWIMKHKIKVLEPTLSDKMTNFTKILDIFMITHKNSRDLQPVKKLLCEYLIFITTGVYNISIYHTVASIKNALLIKVIRKIVSACIEEDEDLLEYAITLDRIFDLHAEDELTSRALRLYFGLTEVLEGYIVESVELMVSELITSLDKYSKSNDELLVPQIHADMLLIASVGESSKLTNRLINQVHTLILGVMNLISQPNKPSPFIIISQTVLCKYYLIPIFKSIQTDKGIYVAYLSKYFDLVLVGLRSEENGLKYVAQESFKYLFEAIENYNIPLLETELEQNVNQIFSNLVETVGMGFSSYPIECVRALIYNDKMKISIEHVVQASQNVKDYATAIHKTDVESFIELINFNKILITYTTLNSEMINCIDQSQSDFYMLMFKSENRDLIEDSILDLLTAYLNKHKYCSHIVAQLINYAVERMDTINEDHLFRFISAVVNFGGLNVTPDIFNNTLIILISKITDIRAVYTLHMVLINYSRFLTLKIGQQLLNSIKIEFQKTQDSRDKAGYIILELLVSMSCSGLVSENQTNFNQIKEHIDDNVVIKNTFHSIYERRALAVGLLHFLSMGPSLEAYSNNIHTLLVILINHITIYEHKNKKTPTAKKTVPIVSKKSILPIDSSDSEQEENDDEYAVDLVPKGPKRQINIKPFERFEAYAEPFVVFKEYIRHLKQNNNMFEGILSKMPIQHSSYIKEVQSFEAVVVDKEKGITEKRKIVKLKPRNN